MLYLETTGYNYSYKRCENIVMWFVGKYLPYHKLDITVNHRGLLCEGVYGWCSVEDCNYRPRAFEIELHNKMDALHYTQTLLHELWHVYQHVKGSLKDKRGKRLWKGIDHSLVDYENQPWELEANTMEVVLYEEYLTSSKNPV
jgi:hypothetical protein